MNNDMKVYPHKYIEANLNDHTLHRKYAYYYDYNDITKCIHSIYVPPICNHPHKNEFIMAVSPLFGGSYDEMYYEFLFYENKPTASNKMIYDRCMRNREEIDNIHIIRLLQQIHSLFSCQWYPTGKYLYKQSKFILCNKNKLSKDTKEMFFVKEFKKITIPCKNYHSKEKRSLKLCVSRSYASEKMHSDMEDARITRMGPNNDLWFYKLSNTIEGTKIDILTLIISEYNLTQFFDNLCDNFENTRGDIIHISDIIKAQCAFYSDNYNSDYYISLISDEAKKPKKRLIKYIRKR